MTVTDRNDAILVKIIEINEKNHKENIISTYYTTAINETLKMFITARDYDIELGFNEFSDVIDDIHKQLTYVVKDIYLNVGSREDLPTIMVYI